MVDEGLTYPFQIYRVMSMANDVTRRLFPLLKYGSVFSIVIQIWHTFGQVVTTFKHISRLEEIIHIS